MAEGGGRTLTPPPAYNEAVSSTIYTIPIESNQPPHQPVYPPAQPVYPSPQPAAGAVTVDRTSPPASGNSAWQPPSYESLFGVRLPKRLSANTTAATASAPMEELPSPSLNTHVSQPPARENNSTPISFNCSASCQEKAKKAFILTAAVVALGTCAAITAMGYVYQFACPADPMLSSMLRTSGIIGIVYFCLLALRAYCQHKKQETNKHKPCFFFLFPLVVIGLFLYGANKAYFVWTKKPCNPIIDQDCDSRFCDGNFLLFSFIFYVTTTIILTPIWFLIVYLIMRLVIMVIGRLCCPNTECIKADQPWFPQNCTK